MVEMVTECTDRSAFSVDESSHSTLHSVPLVSLSRLVWGWWGEKFFERCCECLWPAAWVSCRFGLVRWTPRSLSQFIMRMSCQIFLITMPSIVLCPRCRREWRRKKKRYVLCSLVQAVLWAAILSGFAYKYGKMAGMRDRKFFGGRVWQLTFMCLWLV